MNTGRIYIIYGAILLVGVLFLTKLGYMQIIQGNAFSARADKQYILPVANAFDRGTIFFKKRDGTLLSAATLRSGYTLAINPKTLVDADAAYTKIKAILPDLDQADFFLKAGKKNDPYEVVATHVDEASGLKIQALKITGVGVYKDKWRYYPAESLGAQTVGFVGYKGDEFGGRYGLERQYNDVLSREAADLYVNFFAEVFDNVKQTIFNRTQTTEGDIVLTLEPAVEQTLERNLEGVMNKWHGESVGGIIINPKTGAIYAMAAAPSYNPNNFQSEKDFHIFGNPLIEDVHEMGSIIKPLTMAAGIDSGAVTPASTYNDKGFLEMNGSKINNYDFRGRGVVSMQEVLNQSLNTGVSTVMLRMGRDKFTKYFKVYQLGNKTGIDLPNEATGLVANLDAPRDIEHATASFGQGIAVTPMATARALSSIANGGYLVTPHVTDRILYTIAPDKVFEYPQGPRVLATSTSEQVTRMLVKVVDTALVGGKAKLDNYSVAAKTGTAQIAGPGGKYYTDRYLHSFFGYFPAYDPQFLVVLYVVHPIGAKYASETLTPAFQDIEKFLINYYEVAPDRDTAATSTKP